MEELIDYLLSQNLDDVLVCGYADDESKKYVKFSKSLCFHPMFWKIYFVFDRTVFELDAEGTPGLIAHKIDTITPWFDADDDSFTLSSIYNLLFGADFPVKILSVDYKHGTFTPITLSYRLHNATDREKGLVIIDPANISGFSFTALSPSFLATDDCPVRLINSTIASRTR